MYHHYLLATLPPGVPRPRFQLFQQTVIAQIVGLFWDAKAGEWHYTLDGEDLDIRSETFVLRVLQHYDL
jgi:hypothetical protein